MCSSIDTLICFNLISADSPFINSTAQRRNLNLSLFPSVLPQNRKCNPKRVNLCVSVCHALHPKAAGVAPSSLFLLDCFRKNYSCKKICRHLFIFIPCMHGFVLLAIWRPEVLLGHLFVMLQ